MKFFSATIIIYPDLPLLERKSIVAHNTKNSMINGQKPKDLTILAGIQPAELRRKQATPQLSPRAQEQEHLLNKKFWECLPNKHGSVISLVESKLRIDIKDFVLSASWNAANVNEIFTLYTTEIPRLPLREVPGCINVSNHSCVSNEIFSQIWFNFSFELRGSRNTLLTARAKPESEVVFSPVSFDVLRSEKSMKIRFNQPTVPLLENNTIPEFGSMIGYRSHYEVGYYLKPNGPYNTSNFLIEAINNQTIIRVSALDTETICVRVRFVFDEIPNLRYSDWNTICKEGKQQSNGILNLNHAQFERIKVPVIISSIVLYLVIVAIFIVCKNKSTKLYQNTFHPSTGELLREDIVKGLHTNAANKTKEISNDKGREEIDDLDNDIDLMQRSPICDPQHIHSSGFVFDPSYDHDYVNQISFCELGTRNEAPYVTEDQALFLHEESDFNTTCGGADELKAMKDEKIKTKPRLYSNDSAFYDGHVTPSNSVSASTSFCSVHELT